VLFKKKTVKTIDDYTKNIPNKVDEYILDKNNIIVVTENINTKEYSMTHYKMENETLNYVMSWILKYYYFCDVKSRFILKEHHLFLIPTGRKIDGIYNYELGKFIVKRGLWHNITLTNQGLTDIYPTPSVNYLEEYQGFIAYFTLESDHKKDSKTLFWDNPYTKERMCHRFHVSDNPYFAILNLDGTIRENKLFQGNSFSEIEKVIELDNYGSLEEFMKARKEELNQESFIKSQEYYQKLKENNNSFISPYQEQEVLKVLSRKKK